MTTARSDFPLIGEPLALDLINTRVHTPEGDEDLLSSPGALSAWLAAQSDRLPQPEARLDDADLARVQALRDHIAAAVEHARDGRRPPAAALRAINEAQRAAPLYGELGWSRTGLTTTPRRSGSYTARLCAELAHAAAELLASSSITSVRRCEGPGCVLLFLPAHPRRRWCSPAVCGNRVRVARYYRRHKS